MASLLALDQGILSLFAALSNPVMDSVMIFFTRLGDNGIVWLILAGILLCLPARRSEGVCILLALLLSLLFCNLLLKNLIARERPFVVDPSLQLLLPAPLDWSFPSGHTSSSFAAAFSLCARKSPLRFYALVLAALIAFSRLYLQVHFPGDVLGGILTGLLSAILAHLLCTWLLPKIKRRKQP